MSVHCVKARASTAVPYHGARSVSRRVVSPSRGVWLGLLTTSSCDFPCPGAVAVPRGRRARCVATIAACLVGSTCTGAWGTLAREGVCKHCVVTPLAAGRHVAGGPCEPVRRLRQRPRGGVLTVRWLPVAVTRRVQNGCPSFPRVCDPASRVSVHCVPPALYLAPSPVRNALRRSKRPSLVVCIVEWTLR